MIRMWRAIDARARLIRGDRPREPEHQPHPRAVGRLAEGAQRSARSHPRREPARPLHRDARALRGRRGLAAEHRDRPALAPGGARRGRAQDRRRHGAALSRSDPGGESSPAPLGHRSHVGRGQSSPGRAADRGKRAHLAHPQRRSDPRPLAGHQERRRAGDPHPERAGRPRLRAPRRGGARQHRLRRQRWQLARRRRGRLRAPHAAVRVLFVCVARARRRWERRALRAARAGGLLGATDHTRARKAPPGSLIRWP